MSCSVYGKSYPKHLRCDGCPAVDAFGSKVTCDKEHCVRCGADMKPKSFKRPKPEQGEGG